MDFKYTLVKCNRKSYSIKIDDKNNVIVRAPLYATQRDITKLLEAKRGWIEKIIAENSANPLITEDINGYECAYVYGKKVPVIICGRNYASSDCVRVTKAMDFQAAYVIGLGNRFNGEFTKLQKECGLYAKSVSFRSYIGRWGCCDSENNIIFNFKLLMTEPAVQRYVMVHEICHTVYHNHSKQFWQLVKKFEPDYLALRKKLKSYNFLVNMY